MEANIYVYFPLQTTNVDYLQRKIQLSGFSAYPDGPSSQLIRISGVLLYIVLSLLTSSFLVKTSLFSGKHFLNKIIYRCVRRSTYTVQYNTVQYNTVQYSAVQYSTVQYSTVLYSTVQYSTV